jgi:hypothetical protein
MPIVLNDQSIYIFSDLLTLADFIYNLNSNPTKRKAKRKNYG